MTDQVQPAIEQAPRWLDDSAGVRHLSASREHSTGKHYFPPIPLSSPLASRYELARLADQATLYSYTIIHPNKKSGKQPFVLVYADFPENVRVFGPMSLPADTRPRIGQKLRIEFPVDDLGDIHYLFKPAEEEEEEEGASA